MDRSEIKCKPKFQILSSEIHVPSSAIQIVNFKGIFSLSRWCVCVSQILMATLELQSKINWLSTFKYSKCVRYYVNMIFLLLSMPCKECQMSIEQNMLNACTDITNNTSFCERSMCIYNEYVSYIYYITYSYPCKKICFQKLCIPFAV